MSDNNNNNSDTSCVRKSVDNCNVTQCCNVHPYANNNIDVTNDNNKPEQLTDIQRREKSIKDLTKELRRITNLCEPMCAYTTYQTNMNPEVRILSDINQWSILLFTLKYSVKTSIDMSYLDITDPPESLKQAMEKAYKSLDVVSESLIKSMKEVGDFLQSRITNTETDNKQPILNQMKTDSELLNSKLP